MLMDTLRATAGLLVLRAGPQDLPASPSVTWGAVLAYLSINLVSLAMPGSPFFAGLVQSAVACAVLAAFTHGLLKLRQWPERFGQTYSALLLTGTVFTLVALRPMAEIAPYMSGKATPPLLLTLGVAAILFWRLAVVTHIYRNALEVGIWRSLGVVVLYDFIFLMVMSALASLGLLGHLGGAG